MIFMVKCSFCGKELDRGGGVLFVRKDGSLLYFHEKKCRKNLIELGRKPSKLKWARAGVLMKTAKTTNKPAKA